MERVEYDAIKVMLDTPLDTDNGNTLRTQLAQRAGWQYRVSLAHRQAEHALSTKKGKVFNPSLSSEDKRKQDLEYQVRDEQKTVNELYDLSRILSDQLSLGQSLLRSLEGEARAVRV